MLKHAAKITDVARLARVSPATASRALSQPRLVSATTLERVTDAAQRLSYMPHGAARALRCRRTHTIGAVIPTLDNALYAKATQALQKTLESRCYTLLLGCHEFDLKAETKVVRSLIERGVDGIVLVGAEHDAELFDVLAAFDIPYVLTWSFDASARHPCVGIDNRAAARLITEYLIGLGHRRLAVIAGVTAGNDRARERLAGMLDAASAHGIDIPAHCVIEQPYTVGAGRAAMGALLAADARPTAVLCGNDLLAMGAVMECQAHGVPVPDRMSITGFDDMEAASILVPALTTVRIPMRQLGEVAAEHMLMQLDGADTPRAVEVGVDLMVRGTTAGILA